MVLQIASFCVSQNKTNGKLIFKTVVWSAKMRLNWSRRLAELYQS